MAGSVATFYSFKGGVGRSFALANIGVILAQWGARVLLVDWDIEAPGLNHYFRAHAPALPAGVLDFLGDCQGGVPRPWSAYATPIPLQGARQPLHLMPAASGGGGAYYTRRVQGLDWDQLYEEHDLGARLEALRAEWVREFDLVLVDSRTGVTDFSGLVTAQLPDVLAFMFTANEQSLTGCADIARRAMDARRRMSVDRPALVPLPIPARFDQRDEFDRAKAWRMRFASELQPFFDRWTPLGTDGLSLIDRLTIPYMARWTFGEDLAAEEEPAGTTGTRTPNQVVSYALETLAAMLVQRLTDVPLLVSSRDEYVLTARSTVQGWQAATRRAVDVFVSYTAADREAAQAIANALTVAGFNPQAYEDKPLAHVPWAEQRLEALERADGYLVVFGSTPSLYQQNGEIAQIQRQGLRSRSMRRPIIPVVLPDGKEAFANSALADYQAHFVNPSTGPLGSQLQPAFERLRFARAAGSTVS